jgi:hypothetical protein
MAAMGLGVGFLSSLAAGCESEPDDTYAECECHPARVGTTTIGEPTSDEGEFPDLEGAWLDVQRVDVAPYNPNAPAAVLEYLDGGELVRVKFAAVAPDSEGGNGGGGGANP